MLSADQEKFHLRLFYHLGKTVFYNIQARTQPLSKGVYIVVEQGVRSLIVYCDDSYAVGICPQPT